MLRVVSVVDKSGTAIDRLAQGMKPYHTNLDYTVLPIHPKRPEFESLVAFERLAKGADILDFQYFRTAEMLINRYPWLEDKKKILTHHNPYSIKESDWNTYDAVVANNLSIHKDLSKITHAPLSYIPNTVDTDFWTYIRDWQPEKQVLMVAARIESKKGILPVAEACKKADLKLVLVGSVSNPEYLHAVLHTGVVDFRQQITDEELRELYQTSILHVCNSVDNFESGTLPILEAMLTGCPVLTRQIGHVPDLYNGENMLIHKGQPDEIEIPKLDLDELKTMREKAWNTAKTRSNERRAYLYQKLYRSVMWPDIKPVSVVMPIYGGLLIDSFNAVINQDYENLELIICNDDPSNSFDRPTLPTKDRLVRFINDASKGYGLAKQRNLGIIEATGDIIVFCDQRMLMEKDAVSVLVSQVLPKRWVYGDKGTKKEFVENFSAVRREDIIGIGMFNERINAYGGMSQEIRSRARLNGFTMDYISSAKATPQGSSKNKHTKKDEIIRMKTTLWKLGLE